MLSSSELEPLPESSVEQTESASAAPTPEASSQASLQEPSSVTTSSPSQGSVAPAVSPRGEPVRVVIMRGEEIVLDREITGSIRLRPVGDELWLVPPRGVVNWVNDPRLAGAKPGFPGAAMLAGHISQAGKPGPFYGLTQTQMGDAVTVAYDSGDRVTGPVEDILRPEKLDLPVEKIRSGDKPALWLVTCDPSTPFVNGHYLGNVLLYVGQLTVSR